ncbi:MAG TPA: GNAT family N-acetyltransferase [Nitrospira sp.]|nr:GNAT family N-acetyltransferase [Nitrospira sp.]
MAIRITLAQSSDADVIASMVGKLLHEIMAAVKHKAFGFHQGETATRVRTWIKDGAYTVLLARQERVAEPVGFLALYESYALYAEGKFGTIPEFYVSPAHRSKGVGSALLLEAKRTGETRGWGRLEVTTPPLPEFDRTLAFYQRHGFSVSGGCKLKVALL